MKKLFISLFVSLPLFALAQTDSVVVDTNDIGYKIGYHITNGLHYALYAGVAIYLVVAIRKFTRQKRQ